MGAYFSDSLDRSLRFARADNDGVQYVILCRVVCGDIHATRAAREPNATGEAAAVGKNSVMRCSEATPGRDFVIWDAAQVYPEYVLELRVSGPRVSDDGETLELETSEVPVSDDFSGESTPPPTPSLSAPLGGA